MGWQGEGGGDKAGGGGSKGGASARGTTSAATSLLRPHHVFKVTPLRFMTM